MYAFWCSRFRLDYATHCLAPTANTKSDTITSKQTNAFKTFTQNYLWIFQLWPFSLATATTSQLCDTVEFVISLHCLCVWLSFTLSPRTPASCCNGKTQLSSRMCLLYFSVVGRPRAANTFTYDVPQPEITKLLTALGFMMRTHSSGSQTTISMFSTMRATKWYFYFLPVAFLLRLGIGSYGQNALLLR